MEIRHMRYFLAVAETLHFRQAAEILHLSQPSLSQQIQQVEQELGVTLFDRSSRRVQLTPAGEALLPRVRSVLRNIEEAIQETRRADNGLSGQLTLGFVSTALVGVLPRTMKELQNSIPGIHLNLRECEPREQISNLLQGSTDIGFMHAVLEEPSLSCMVIQRDHLVVALPEELAKPGPVSLREYAQYTSVMPSPFTSFGFFSHVQRAYQAAGVTTQNAIYTNLIIGGIHLVSAGIGIAVVPSSFQTVCVPGVVYRELTEATPAVELLAVWKTDSTSRLLYRFLEILKSHSPDA